MPTNLIAFLITALATGPPISDGHGDDHRTNWARAKQGASVVVAPAIHPSTDAQNLIGKHLGKDQGAGGTTIFADGAQRERVVIDLGQERLIGRVFIGGNPNSLRRHPNSVTIRGSRESPEGAWETLISAGNMRLQHTFVFDNTPVRFLEIDFGDNKDGVGSRITCFGAFTRYRCPEATVVVQWLAALYHRQTPGLAAFFRAADAEEWEDAVKALRDFYSQRQPGLSFEASERSRKIANDMIVHRFQFGDPVHQFGARVKDIDWAFERDYEWTNSLNRCGFWTHTAKVYMVTGDKRYAEEIERQLLHWIESCPLPPRPKDGRYRSWQYWDCPARITWRSLDSAIRLWKLCDLAPIMAADQRFSDRACLNLLYAIWEHLSYLKDDDWDGGNWLSTVTSSVMDAAVAFSEFRDSVQWLTFAKAAFEKNVLRDVREDGKEIENSIGYVQFAYKSMFNVLKTLTERGVEVNPEVRRRLDLLQDFIGWCLFPDLTTPMIGDADQSGTYPLDRTWSFFNRQDIRYILTQGKEGEKPAVGSRHWPSSGWAVMRSDWGEGAFTDAFHAIFKASPTGPHGHLDQLSVTLYALGRPLLIDAGRCNYRAEGRVFRSTPYHNTITIDGASQAHGPAKFERWESTAEYDLAVGSHKLYRDILHRRTILFVKPHFWLVRDDMIAEETHRYEQRWHFPEQANPQESAGHVVTTRFTKGSNLLLAPLTPLKESFPEDYEIAYRWDNRIPARLWSYAPAGASLITLLIPYRGMAPPEWSIEAFSSDKESMELRVRIRDRTWRLSVALDRPVLLEKK